MRLIDDTRGSATSEGVIVVPFFALVFALVLYGYGRYREESANATEVYGAVWPEAVAGCEDGAPASGLADAVSLYRPRVRAQIPALDPYFDRVRARTISARRATSVARPAAAGGGEVFLEEETRVECNPVPIDWSAAERTDSARGVWCDLTPHCSGSPGRP